MMLTVCLCLFIGVCLGVEVHQSPPQLLVKVGEEAQLVCSHQRGDYRVMQWYQQSPGESALKRIGACLSLEVHQTPEEILIKPGGRAEMVCQHSRTDYRQMLWYKYSTENNLMDLIGYLYYEKPTMEEPLGFSATVLQSEDQFSLVTQEDNHKGQLSCIQEHDTSEPQVQIFTPAEKECQASSQRKAWKKTLVCVASGFYPDHVEVTWDIDGTRATRNVATDSLAQREEGSHKYRITSRLMVEAQTWARAGIKYTCTVSFYNGTRRRVTQENPSPNNVPNTVRFQRLSQGAKLSYVTLIVKSAVYGAFVVLLLWKMKGPRSAH
ncbi:T cell receptor beta chain MC.7.G5-like [Synchiropus splendidus]|uniref:T cell receptor beta chain MC.7.G5-like n=1 Tax=Synchiropus splendidus TaxID=270530 RepID=UPI00237E4D18|nr:T cell receptor beta chain MC.7.G5-like [Synchiropus splendidus]